MVGLSGWSASDEELREAGICRHCHTCFNTRKCARAGGGDTGCPVVECPQGCGRVYHGCKVWDMGYFENKADIDIDIDPLFPMIRLRSTWSCAPWPGCRASTRSTAATRSCCAATSPPTCPPAQPTSSPAPRSGTGRDFKIFNIS